MKKIILASQSPRRQDLLLAAGYQIEIFPPKLSEFLDKNLSLDRALIAIARQKAGACEREYAGLLPREGTLLSADTMVVLDGEALGKPLDRSQAKSFIARLSGKTHQVKTAVYLKNLETQEELEFLETTEVEFRALTEEEVELYLDLGEWTDKAGAYGIQGEAGKFVAAVKGSLSNVIGLPVESLGEKLKELE